MMVVLLLEALEAGTTISSATTVNNALAMNTAARPA